MYGYVWIGGRLVNDGPSRERGDEYIVGQEAHTYRYEAGGAAVLASSLRAASNGCCAPTRAINRRIPGLNEVPTTSSSSSRGICP